MIVAPDGRADADLEAGSLLVGALLDDVRLHGLPSRAGCGVEGGRAHQIFVCYRVFSKKWIFHIFSIYVSPTHKYKTI